MKRWALILALAISTVGWTQGSQAVIKVNGESVATDTYTKRMAVLSGVGRLVGNRFVSATPGFLTLQQLINEMLMVQLAKSKGVEPTAKEIQDELDRNIKDDPEFVKSYLRSGLTEADLRYELKVQLSEFKVTTLGVTITDFQVKKFYDDQKREFTIPKKYRLRIVAVNSADLKSKVDADLTAGKKFSDVATQYSQDISKVDGGLLGDLDDTQMTDQIKQLVTPMKAGTTSPWLGGDSGTEVKFFLEKVTESYVLPFDDMVKYKVWKKLMLDRGNVKNSVSTMMDNMRKNAKFEFTGTPFDEQLKQVFGG